MRIKKHTQMMLAQGANPADFTEQFNEMMEKVSRFNYEKPVVDIQSLTAYVIYTYEEREIETIEDERELHGEKFYCKDCDHFYEDGGCPFRRKTDRMDKVCKEFWDAYENHEPIVYAPKNRDGSINKTTKQGKRYMKLKAEGAIS